MPLGIADVDVGIVLGLVSLSGLTGIGAWRVALRYSRRNLFLRMRVNEPLDVVLSTSLAARTTQPVSYRRTLVSVGHLESVTAFSAAVGAIKRRDQIVVHTSGHVAHALERDLVLIGGPVKNEISRLFLDRLDLAYPDLGLRFEQEGDGAVRVAVGGATFDVATSVGELACDYGLVVAWVNPFAIDRRRGILCAGLTSHGTAAAATYLLGPVIEDRHRRLRTSRLATLWEWPAFVLLLRLVVGSDGRFDAVEELAFVPLDPPAAAQLPIHQPMQAPQARLRGS